MWSEKLMRYSIDKLKIEFLYVKHQKVNEVLKSLELDPFVINYYESNKLTSCKHNFVFETSEGATFYLGIVPNWRKEERYDKNIVLEYNPNKVNPFGHSVLKFLLNYPKVLWNVSSFDIACDLDVPYNTLVMTKRDKREYFADIGHSEVETRYLGRFGHNGHIKLYNKAIEQKVDKPWSRFEITIKKIKSISPTLSSFSEFCKLPNMYRRDVQLSSDYLKLSSIWRLALDSVIDDINKLYTIDDYKTRRKMEKMLSEVLESVDISVQAMYDTYIDYFNSLFDSNIENNDFIEFEAVLRCCSS